MKKLTYELKKCVGIIFAFSVILLANGTNRVYAYSQSLENITSGSYVNCGIQLLGTGIDTDLHSVTIKVYNNTGGNVPVNGWSLQIYEYDDSTYTCTYPCTLNQRSPDSWTTIPSDRRSGDNVTSGSDPFYIRAVWNTGTLHPNKYYIIGYKANNSGNRLKIVGTDTNAWAGGEFRWHYDQNNYCRVDQPKTFSETGNGLQDMFFSINDAVNPTVILSGSQPPDLTDQTIKLNLSGTMPVGSQQRLDILGWSYCTKTGYASYHSTTPDAHITFYSTGNGTCLTSTEDKGGGYYNGAGWCYSPYNSTWSATGIKFPYPNDGYTCQYPISYNLLTYQNGNWTLTETGDITTLSTIPSGSGAGTDCSGLDTGSYIVCKLKTLFSDAFGFQNIDTSIIGVLTDQLNAKAPFAYAMSVFAFDTTAPLTSTSAPALTFVFATSAPSYTWQPDAGTDTVLTAIRSVLSVLLWGLLVAYIVLRVRSFSEKL
jgi:hypothetical protein